MFRRALLRQSQAAKSALSVRPLSTVSLSQRMTASIQSRQIAKPLPAQLSRRYASTETEGEKKEGEAAAPTEEENGVEALNKALEAKKQEAIELKDRYLRSVADFANLQDRTRREVETARMFGIQKFAQDLVESVDNLDRALGAVPADLVKDAEANKQLYELYSGLKMTERILLTTLKKHGLERFDPSELEEGKPQKFDPARHEATFMAPSPDKADGEVMYTQSKGFLLNGRVLRAAKVGVVKNE